LSEHRYNKIRLALVEKESECLDDMIAH